MKVSFGDIVGAFLDRIFQPLSHKVDHMSQQVTDLQAAVSALTAVVSTTTANETALKQKLDAAIAANVDLAAQLAAAQAGQGDPADAAAITASTASIAAATQSLSDAAAASSPAN